MGPYRTRRRGRAGGVNPDKTKYKFVADSKKSVMSRLSPSVQKEFPVKKPRSERPPRHRAFNNLRRIFISKIPPFVKSNELKQLISTKMLPSHKITYFSGISDDCAFVSVSPPTAGIHIIQKMNGMIFGSHTITVTCMKEKEMLLFKEKHPKDLYFRNPSIIISNVSFDIPEEDIVAHFSCPNLMKVFMEPPNVGNRLHTGKGLMFFKHQKGMKRFLVDHQYDQLEGRRVFMDLNRDLLVNAPEMNEEKVLRYKILIENIAMEVSKFELEEIFTSEVDESVSVFLKNHPTAPHSGTGRAQFKSKEGALRAVQALNGCELGSQKIVLKESFTLSNDTSNIDDCGDESETEEIDDEESNIPENIDESDDYIISSELNFDDAKSGMEIGSDIEDKEVDTTVKPEEKDQSKPSNEIKIISEEITIIDEGKEPGKSSKKSEKTTKPEKDANGKKKSDESGDSKVDFNVDDEEAFLLTSEVNCEDEPEENIARRLWARLESENNHSERMKSKEKSHDLEKPKPSTTSKDKPKWNPDTVIYLSSYSRLKESTQGYKHRVLMTNISFGVDVRELAHHIFQHVGGLKMMLTFEKAVQRLRNAKLLEFSSPFYAKKCIDKMNNYELFGKFLRAYQDCDSDRGDDGQLVHRKSKHIRRSKERASLERNHFPEWDREDYDAGMSRRNPSPSRRRMSRVSRSPSPRRGRGYSKTRERSPFNRRVERSFSPGRRLSDRSRSPVFRGPDHSRRTPPFNQRGGRGENPNFCRGGGDDSNVRGGNSNNFRGGRGINSSPTRGGRGANSSPIKGGRGANSNPVRGGRGANSNPVRGGRGVNFNPIRGGRGANSNPVRGANFHSARGGRGANSNPGRGGINHMQNMEMGPSGQIDNNFMANQPVTQAPKQFNTGAPSIQLPNNYGGGVPSSLVNYTPGTSVNYNANVPMLNTNAFTGSGSVVQPSTNIMGAPNSHNFVSGAPIQQPYNNFMGAPAPVQNMGGVPNNFIAPQQMYPVTANVNTYANVGVNNSQQMHPYQQQLPVALGTPNFNPGKDLVVPVASSSDPNEETFGLSKIFLSHLQIALPLLKQILVTSLNRDVTETDIKELFGIAGTVFKVQHFMERGQAVVEMKHEVEAVQAISMLHNQEYFDQRISVKMLRPNDPDNPLFQTAIGKSIPKGLKAIGQGLGHGGLPLATVNPDHVDSRTSVKKPDAGFVDNTLKPDLRSSLASAKNTGAVDQTGSRWSQNTPATDQGHRSTVWPPSNSGPEPQLGRDSSMGKMGRGGKASRFSDNTNVGSSNLNVGASNPNVGASNPNVGLSNQNFGATNQNFGTNNPNFSAKNQNFETKNSNFGAKNTNFGPSRSNFGADIPKKTGNSYYGHSSNNVPAPKQIENRFGSNNRDMITSAGVKSRFDEPPNQDDSRAGHMSRFDNNTRNMNNQRERRGEKSNRSNPNDYHGSGDEPYDPFQSFDNSHQSVDKRMNNSGKGRGGFNRPTSNDFFMSEKSRDVDDRAGSSSSFEKTKNDLDATNKLLMKINNIMTDNSSPSYHDNESLNRSTNPRQQASPYGFSVGNSKKSNKHSWVNPKLSQNTPNNSGNRSALGFKEALESEWTIGDDFNVIPTGVAPESQSQSCEVILSNLPRNTVSDSICELCMPYGVVRDIDINVKHGTGRVVFVSPHQARLAADVLNNQIYNGAVMKAFVA